MPEKQDVTYYLMKVKECTPGSLYWKDRQGRYLGCNRFMANIAGVESIESIIGKTDEELWPQFAYQLSHNDQYVIESGETIYTEEKVNVSGILMHFVGVKSPLRNNAGEIIGVIGNSLDITNLKHAQEQLERDKKAIEAENYAKSEFIANMSHDIRTPLSGIIGLTEILISRLQNSATAKFANDAHRAAKQLMQLLNEILEISDIDAGKSMDNEQVFNLKSILDSIRDLMAPSVEQKGLLLHIDYDNSIPETLCGYRILLHRILLNLVSNAIKFTLKGKINISVELLAQNKEYAQIKICVADTGIGIPNDKLDLIFEPFKRLSPAYENNYDRTGLGLYVVKKFMDVMSGTINVRSDLNQGTSFELLLSFKTSILDQQTQIKESTLDQALNPIDLSYRIPSHKNYFSALLVEDDPMAQVVSQIQLKKHQCKVTVASSGKEAIDYIEGHNFDLILMDIGLPDKNGAETSKEIRAVEIKNQRIPIIALTAHLSDRTLQDCKKSGVNYVLQKPLTYKLAYEIVQELLINRSPHSCSINIDEATSLVGGNKETAIELLTLFVKQLPEEINTIRYAVACQDWDNLRKAVHKLHGAASYCGASKLQTICYDLENILKSSSIGKTNINELLKQLFMEINAIQEAFSSM